MDKKNKKLIFGIGFVLVVLMVFGFIFGGKLTGLVVSGENESGVNDGGLVMGDGDEVLGEVENISFREDNESVVNESIEEDLNLTESAENVSVGEDNESTENVSVVEDLNFTEVVNNEGVDNVSVVEDVLNDTVEVADVVEFSTLQYKAVIGRPVKWLKRVALCNASDVGCQMSGNLSIEIPGDAVNISVLTNGEIDEVRREFEDYADVVAKADREEVSRGGLLTGNVALDIIEGKGWLVRFWDWLSGFTVSGNVVLEGELRSAGNIVDSDDVKIIDVAETVAKNNASEVAVEYYTEGPIAFEEVIEKGKRIVISGDDVYGYTDILAYTLVDEKVEMGSLKLKLYHYEMSDVGGQVLERKVEVDYVSEDFDGDGFVDYVEWVVPHLSEQVYDLVIEIVGAELLDSNRNFVRDVYNETSVRDGVFVLVNDSDYVRVVFESELDSSRDITIFARKKIEGCGDVGVSECRVEVYRKGGNESVAVFENVLDAKYYKVYLDGLGLNESLDTFDLRVSCQVLGGEVLGVSGNETNEQDFCGVEFDLIIDPANVYNLTFVSPTPTSGATKGYAEVNVSVLNAGDLSELIYNWNGTNYSVYDEGLVALWNFDGDGNDEFGNYNLTMSSAGYDSGRYGQAGNFSGAQNSYAYSSLGQALSPDMDSFSFSAWIYPRNFSSIDAPTYSRWIQQSNWCADPVATPCNWFVLDFTSTGAISVGMWGYDDNAGTGIATAAGSVSLNKWQYISCVIDRQRSRGYIYVNGIMKQNSSISNLIGSLNMTANFEISGTWGEANMKVDDFRYYRRALSSDDVKGIYMSNLNKYSSTDWGFYFTNLDALPGNYSYRVFAKDGVGGENSSEERSVFVDDAVYEMSDETPNISNMSVYRVYGSEYDSATFGSKDVRFLNTSDALLNASAGGHNSQVFVHLVESVVAPVNFYWKGYGENYSGYPVYFYAYNFSGSAWALQGSGLDILSNTEKSVLSLTSDYFGVGNLIYVWVKSMARVIVVTPIVISGLGTSNVGTTYFDVGWTTNIGAYGKVGYGTVSQTGWPGYANYDNDGTCNPCTDSSVPGGEFGTSHLISVAGLTANTTYYYRAMSCEDVAQTNCAVSSQGSVTTASSCPFIYSWNGTEYVFDSEAITAFGTVAENEGKQPSRLPNLKSVDGKYKLRISEELDEISYIDSVELLKVSHSEDVEVYRGFREEVIRGWPRVLNRDVSFEAIRDIKNLYEKVNEFFPENPSFTFKFYTIRDKIAPLNVTERGEVVDELMEFDGEFWNDWTKEDCINSENFVFLVDSDNDSIIDSEINSSDFYKTAEFVFPRNNSSKAKLLLRIKESDAFDWTTRSLYFSSKNHDLYDPEAFAKLAIREGSYRIKIWNGTDWINEIFIMDFPREKASDIVVPLDLSNINTDFLKIKVQVLFAALLLDGAYVDYSEDVDIKVEKMNFDFAEKGGVSVKKTISSNDEDRISLTKGDSVYLEFSESVSDLKEVEETTMFLNVKGYYLPLYGSDIYNIIDPKHIKRIYEEDGFTNRFWSLKWHNHNC